MSTRHTLLSFFSILVIITMLFSGLSLPSASAQGSDGIERQLNPQTGKVSFISPADGQQSLPAADVFGDSRPPQDPAMALAKRYGPEFGLKDPGRDLQQFASDRAEDGRLTVRYQQNYQGIPVIGGELIVNTNDNGDLYSLNGEVSSSLSLSTQPAIASETAGQTALRAAAKWYQKPVQDFLASEPKLWIYDESLLQPSNRPVELVWRMEVTSRDAAMAVRELVLVNAQQGGISLHFNQVDTAWTVTGSSGAAQEDEPTPTPFPTETPLPRETPTPTAEITSTEDTSSLAVDNVIALDGAIWYVSTTGNNSNSCSTSALPCLTIDGAIGKAGTGDVIRVTSGTYTGNNGNIVTISKSLTLSGGWDSTFTTQSGASIIDGGSQRNGILANAAGSTVIVEYFVIQNAYTSFDSGGIYEYGANLILRNSSVINNKAARGAGIFLINNASLTLINSTVSGNTATTSGGGIYAVNGSVTINNSTIVKNSSNTGGGITKESGTLSIKNAILAKNTGIVNNPDCSGSINSSDHNIIGNTSGCTVTSGTGDQLNTDPQIDLSLSGTLPLHALLANSPAINAGDNNTCLTIDQRGMPRPNGNACDIGAYEHTTTGGPFVISGSNQSTRLASAFALPFKVYLLDSSANPVTGATVTFTAPSTDASGTFADSGTRVTTAVTDSNGYATSALFTANSQVGFYTVSATAEGYDSSAMFSLTNSLVDLYVAPGGSDSNTCNSPASPCQTINGAITKATPGNTIAIANGTYTGTGAEVVLINKAVMLLGGWDSTFSTQNGMSIVDGQGARRGISNTGTGVVIEHFKIQGGFHTSQGGGIYNSNGTLTLSNSAVSDNRSGWMGGGIYNYGTLTINNTTISKNIGSLSGSGGGGGAGIQNYSGTVVLNNSTVSENVMGANYSGSAIVNFGTSFQINNSTITNNTGAAESIYNSSGTLTLNNSTVTKNTRVGIRNQSGTVQLQNTILANNSTAYSGQDCTGNITSSGHNLIGTTTGCTFTASTGDQINTNPLLSSYLIGTPPYYALASGSPAIDAGNPATCLSTDQRGLARPQGSACDIGAYEYSVPGAPASVGVVSGSEQRAAPGFPFSLPLMAYVVDSTGSPVTGVNVTFTAPTSGPSGTFTASGTNTTTIATNGEGVAVSSTFSANTQLGAYNVTASVSGLPGTANFALTNYNLFVSPTGNDGNSCDSPASACLTINAAITKASNGGVIKIAAGTYTGSGSQVVSLTKNVTLSGGWNTAFSMQNGFSVIDGQLARVGIYNNSTNSTLDRLIIQNGYTTSTGAGINHQQGTLTINRSLITNNKANNTGGGIYSVANLIINDSTISNNSSTGGGGIAVSVSTNSLTLNNSTVTGNQTTGSGGGIVLTYSSVGGTPGTITIQNSTIVNNTAQGNGGGFSNGGGSPRPVNITNSILAKNSAKSSGPNCNGVINIFDHSLIDNASNCTLANGTGNILDANPLISTYLLSVPGVHALQQSSPAINAGVDCLSTDQRGVSRPQGGGCDIGAYEYMASGAAASFGIANGSNQRTGQLLPFPLPLVVYVVDSLGSPVSGVNVTFQAPESGVSGTFADSGINTAVVATNSEGAAISPIFTANSQLGTYNVMATVLGLDGSANFVLSNASWFVSITGNDGNSCSSPAAPCLTINGAINKAFSGDVIKVASGVYTGFSYTVVNISKNLRLSGGWDNSFSAQTGFSIIDGSFGAYHGFAVNASDVSISRFIVRSSNSGIYHSGGTLRFEQGALIDNKNGIYNYDGDTTFINTTISANHASGTAGSAISNVRGTTTIRFSTITNNTGSYAIYSANGYAFIKIGNSILAGNSGGDCYIGSNPNISEGNNIFRNLPACSGSVILHSTDQTGTDPKLRPLLVGSYHAILPDSPAHEAANSVECPATDQRGMTRPAGVKCDIGAIEYRATGTTPAYLIAYEGMGQSIPLNNPAPTKLKAVVLDANDDGVAGVTVTFTAPASGASAVFASTGTNTATVVTDANGVAASTLSANHVPGPYTVTATVAGLANTADFQLTNVDAGSPSSISIVSGSNQSAPLQTEFSQLLKAKVKNSLGQPLSGRTVTFTAPASGASGTFADTHTRISTAVTDANGIATASAFTANNIRGGYIVMATVAGLEASANFQMFNGVQTIKTYTANNGISLPGTFLCGQTKPNCTNNADPHADAAHRYAIGTSTLYGNQHGRDSIDNRGMAIISTVHFSSGYANAFWNGDQMVYGDAYGFPLADDVVAHELTHGVTQYESNLFYYYQSGAINESFSDIWGEYYDQTNGQGNDTAGVKWLMGEDVSGWGAIRSMSDPTWYGDPDKMSSGYYFEGEEDNGGVHYNSGINNKAAYLMVDGGTFNGKTVTALGWTRTAAIYYEANSKLLSSGADYSDLYYALQKACSNLVGQKGITTANCAEVKDAVDAVEMNGQPAPNFNTDAPLCAAGTVLNMVFADDLENGTGKWTFTNGAYPRWQLDSLYYGPYAQSGNHSLYADDNPGAVTDATAKLTPLTVPSNAFLNFAHAYGFETGIYSGALQNFDGGVLEYSTNGGATWTDAGSLINFNGYKGTIFTGAGNPLSGRSAFVGSSHGYIGTRLNLASLAGKSVSFRWRMGLDEAASNWGWWVDNIKLYTCIPIPGAFNKTAPSNGSTDVALSTTLSWNSSPNATSYEYCYDVIDDNQCNRTWGTVAGTSAPISSLGANTTYYWQVRASNPVATTEADNQNWGSFTTTSTLPAGTADLETFISGTLQGKYSLGSGLSLRESYIGVNNGPLMIRTANSIPMIAAERVIYRVNDVDTSFSEMMALPASQLDAVYWLPWYNNKDLNTQLRIANVSDTDATVNVSIGGDPVDGSPYTLAPGASKRLSFPDVDKGPVKIESNADNVRIVAAERVIYNVSGLNTSYSEMMALPNKQLDTTYWLPWYNSKSLNTQLRIANVSLTDATVNISIAGTPVTGSPFTIPAGGSKRLSFPDIDKGPVKIEGDVNIVAAERVIYEVNGVNTSFSETMAVPAGQLDTTYWLPWYNNKNLDTQLRIANVSDAEASVQVFIRGVEVDGSPFALLPGQSTRKSFPGIDKGPVQIVSTVPIVAAERVIYKVDGLATSFSELMSLPEALLDVTYWLPWYNNVDLNTQLRFGIP